MAVHSKLRSASFLMAARCNRPGDLWAITTHFNPFDFQSRRDNFRRFREHLNLPLLAVELGFGGRFDLDLGAATALLRVRGESVLWQKERLLDVALAALPRGCTKVAWVDCDVVFQRHDWATRASRALDEVPLLQLFDRAVELPRDGRNGVELESFARRYVERRTDLTSHGERSDPGERVHDYTPGLAWAARRELMEREGFYDGMVVGGGDSAMAKAAIGQHVDFADYVGLDGAHRGHYLAWAERFHGAVAGRIAALPGTAYSLWHGDVARRRYRSRHSILHRHRFDPSTDVEIDDGGAFRWSSKKPAMHQEVRAYFASRREDESAVGSAGAIGLRVREHDLVQKAS